MAQPEVHIIPKNLAKGHRFENGTLMLHNGGNFYITVKEYEDLVKAHNKKLEVLEKKYHTTDHEVYDYAAEKWKQHAKEGWTEEKLNENFKANKAEKEREIKLKSQKLEEGLSIVNKKHIEDLKKFDDLNWVWQLVGSSLKAENLSHNITIMKGFDTDSGLKEIMLPSILVGGGRAWIEAFHETYLEKNEILKGKATVKIPNGFFVNANGKPKILSAQWKNKDDNPITDKVAFGSTVYLHIYTEALYGQTINIKLRDTKNSESDLSPSNVTGLPTQKPQKDESLTYAEKINVHTYYTDKPQTIPPSGSIIGSLNADETERLKVQKCVLTVFVDPVWQYQGGRANDFFVFDSGTELEINPIVYHAQIENGEIDLDDFVLKVSKEEGVLYEQDETNMPALVGEVETDAPEYANTIDFTFGIFIDGTLNSMYNSKARQDFEKRTGIVVSSQKKPSQKILDNYDEEKYKYGDDSSYENDLSNPAIIFQNYNIPDETKETHPVFKIYTEGIGTTTAPGADGILHVADYKSDNKIGFALGTTALYENAGIVAKVLKSVDAMAEKILKVMKKNTTNTIGVITVDVFGFSRGAAAARNFVHEILYPSYNTMGGALAYDRHADKVDNKYAGKRLPKNGRLGYLLQEANQPFNQLKIRFAGLYDTVPHHGLFQNNDIYDLGLDRIDQAEYVVHMIADDEHRANFSLVDISTVIGKKGGGHTRKGVELYLPGVHCDVGGSYVEGRKEDKVRIESLFNYHELKKVKNDFVAQGWFKDREIKLWAHIGSADVEINDNNYNLAESKIILNSYRKYLSNQYSYIPLQLMSIFCLQEAVPVDNTNINNKYQFSNNKVNDNVNFLNRIFDKLYTYAFNGGEPYRTVDADLMFLRNNYLHWNSVWGQDKLMDLISQPYHPNMVGDKRERHIR